MIKNL